MACAFLETQTEPQHELWRSLGIVAEFFSSEFMKSRPGVLGRNLSPRRLKKRKALINPKERKSRDLSELPSAMLPTMLPRGGSTGQHFP